MATSIDLQTYSDSRGHLTVIEKVIPFEIKRVYYIYGVDNSTRGGHRHHKTLQAAVCVSGSCVIECHNGLEYEIFYLDSPSKCVLIDTNDWHIMNQFSEDAVLLVMASELYDFSDYIFEPYV